MGDTLARCGLAAASGVLLALAFPRSDLTATAWVALVPVLLAARGRPLRAAFALGWLTGGVFFAVVLSWVFDALVRHTDMPTALAAVVFLAGIAAFGLYVAVFVAGCEWLARRGCRGIAWGAALWVVLEWARGRLVLGFPWAMLGTSQYRFSGVIQIAEVTGVYGVSAVLVASNLAAARLLARRGDARGRRRALVALVVLAGVVPAAGAWRAATVRRAPTSGTVRVALVQGDVSVAEKWAPDRWRTIVDRHAALSRAALAAVPDLVVWPEAAVPFFFQDPGPAHDAVTAVASELGVPLLFGAVAYRPRGPTRQAVQRNRAYLLVPGDGAPQAYDKLALVPFGEYVPLAPLLPFARQIVPASAPIEPGSAPTLFVLPQARFGCAICWEIVAPSLVRRFVADGADFIVNISNDAWFGGSAGPYQHLAQATLRTVENRVPLVRVANTGISAVIDADGRIAWQGAVDVPLWHVAAIARPAGRSFYARHGDVFVAICLATTAVAIARARRARP